MLTFATVFMLRLYYPRWKEEWRYYYDRSRRNNYGRWAMGKDWEGSLGYS